MLLCSHAACLFYSIYPPRWGVGVTDVTRSNIVRETRPPRWGGGGVKRLL